MSKPNPPGPKEAPASKGAAANETARGPARPGRTDPFDDVDSRPAGHWIAEELQSAGDQEASGEPPGSRQGRGAGDRAKKPRGAPAVEAQGSRRGKASSEPADPPEMEKPKTNLEPETDREPETEFPGPDPDASAARRAQKRRARARARAQAGEQHEAHQAETEEPTQRDESMETDSGPVPRRQKRQSRRRAAAAGAPAARSLEDLTELDEVDLADLPPPPPSLLRRPPWWGLLGAVLLALIVAGILLGEWNEQRYFLVCKAETAEAHQGRGFPWPFGHHRLEGLRYRPVPLDSAAQCASSELTSEQELQQTLLRLVIGELERRWPIESLKRVARARRLLSQGRALAQGDAKAAARLTRLAARLDLREGELVLEQAEDLLARAKERFDRARAKGAGDPKTRADLSRLTRLTTHLLARLRAGSIPAPPRDRPPRRVEPAAPGRPGSARMSAESMPPRPPAPSASPGARPIPRERSAPAPQSTPAPIPDAGVTGGGLLL